MTPLPVNPKVAILLNDNDEVVGVASNIAPTPELDVQVTRSQRIYDDLALGKQFVTGTLPRTDS
jgi:hypothetical protein